MKIVILDDHSVRQDDLDWHQLEQLPNVELTTYERTPANLTVERSREAEGVFTNKVVFDKAIIEQLPKLRYIGVLATGYNVVDLEAAHKHGITVTYIPAYSTPSVAQLVFALLLHVTNSVAHYAEENSKGRWTQSPDFMWMDTKLTELEGKTMVIRGMGNIGMRVANIAKAMGMRVVAVSNRTDLPSDIERATWSEALKQADILSLNCPLTEETREIINDETLALMQPSAIIINTGRGPLVNERAVAKALNENRIQAYCADVLSVEPARKDCPLLTAPRCYLTPHIAWASSESRQRLIDVAVENLVAFISGNPKNVVS